MLYAQNINDCLASEIGDGGLEQAAFERYLNKVSVFLPSIRAGVANGEIPFLNLPKRNSDLPEIRETAARFRGITMTSLSWEQGVIWVAVLFVRLLR